jgi:hypothetical protein
MLEVDTQGNERFTTCFHRADEFMNFTAVQQQFALTTRRVVLKVTKFILTDVGIIDPDLAFLHTAESLTNLRVARADCFDFGALKNHTCLKAVAHKIIVMGFTITDLALLIRGFFFGAHVSSFPLFGERRGRALKLIRLGLVVNLSKLIGNFTFHDLAKSHIFSREALQRLNERLVTALQLLGAARHHVDQDHRISDFLLGFF